MLEKKQGFTASNYYISQFYHLLRRQGFDANKVLEKAGLSADIVDQPSQRVDREKLSQIAMDVFDLLDDEAMTFATAPIPRGCFYMMGRLTCNEESLGNALNLAIRFYAMTTQAFSMSLIVEDDTATLRFDMGSAGQDAFHLFSEINLMAWHRYSCWLISENIPLKDIYFDYPPPPQVGEYSYLFPGNHVFDHDFCGFSFHKKFLDKAGVRDKVALRSFIRKTPAELFTQPKTDFSLSADVHHLLLKGFKEGFPKIEEVAQHFHLTKRTLARKLKDEGTSFQGLKDHIRRDKAIHLLTSQSFSVAEVAEKIGFSDSAVFARAFKVWTGHSPKEYRDKYLQGAFET